MPIDNPLYALSDRVRIPGGTEGIGYGSGTIVWVWVFTGESIRYEISWDDVQVCNSVAWESQIELIS